MLGHPRLRHWQIWCLVRAWFIEGHLLFFCAENMAGRAREFSGVSFIRTPIPVMKALPSWPNHASEVPPPNTIAVRVRITTCEFWWDINIQSIIQLKGEDGTSLWLSHKESACQCRWSGFDSWSRKTPHTEEQISLFTKILSLCFWAQEPQLFSPHVAATDVWEP